MESGALPHSSADKGCQGRVSVTGRTPPVCVYPSHSIPRVAMPVRSFHAPAAPCESSSPGSLSDPFAEHTLACCTPDITQTCGWPGTGSIHAAEFGHLPDNITVLEGESVILRCKIDEEVTHKAWLNRSNILFTGTDKWSLDSRVSLVNSNDSDFSIQIERVAVADEGPYTCSFQARNQPRTAHVYLIVQGDAPLYIICICMLLREQADRSCYWDDVGGGTGVPARIVNISQDKSVNEGDDVNLFCLAVGRPEPTITWKDFKYGRMYEGEFLDITEIKRHQAEEFECITNNGVAPPDTRRVKVTVNYPPVITDVKNMPAQLGKTAILRCEAMAVPTAAFEWFRDDRRPVESDNTLKIKNEKTRSLLLFTNVTEKHFGNYTCFASNRLGASNASMLLFSEYMLARRSSSLPPCLAAFLSPVYFPLSLHPLGHYSISFIYRAPIPTLFVPAIISPPLSLPFFPFPPFLPVFRSFSVSRSVSHITVFGPGAVYGRGASLSACLSGLGFWLGLSVSFLVKEPSLHHIITPRPPSGLRSLALITPLLVLPSHRLSPPSPPEEVLLFCNVPSCQVMTKRHRCYERRHTRGCAGQLASTSLLPAQRSERAAVRSGTAAMNDVKNSPFFPVLRISCVWGGGANVFSPPFAFAGGHDPGQSM
ncbi:hypothetical protein P4O66_004897 [Electrophorus voltai]|uniref:Ig-like domain-containing protein n=1 Tax=Electrophorus voltai TaxID=2609070 RepID=A0AAD9A011_9TELE|nr:hypothetical protein P4O66_004897 [Electrophorus voltai]